ncbi:uncharacterized protein DS421_3g79150 [Arachis hypogaea]|nr:uncharacterized protein DS421_3g79150 [Arachis hypogaea]
MNKPLRLQRFPSFKLQFHGNIISAFLFLSPVEIQNPVNHVIQCARSLHQPSKSRKVTLPYLFPSFLYSNFYLIERSWFVSYKTIWCSCEVHVEFAGIINILFHPPPPKKKNIWTQELRGKFGLVAFFFLLLQLCSSFWVQR